MPNFLKVTPAVIAAALLASCVSSDVLESASSSSASNNTAPQPVQQETVASATQTPDETLPGVESIAQEGAPSPQPEPAGDVALAALPESDTPETPQITTAPTSGLDEQINVPVTNAPRKTYLINGLMSAVPFIGYGFRNLKKKMPEAKLYSYMGVVEGPAAIAPAVIKDAEAAYRRNPNTKINLIGISLGANLITSIAEKLHKKNVPVHYLGIVDGTSLRPITANVRTADNLTCSYLDCTRAPARLARGNSTTVLTKKVYQSSHIPLGNHDGLHARVIAQSK